MLYDKSLEKDNCGFGLIAHIEGEPSHKVVRTAIHALARMQHRGAILADGKTGDGCGLLLQKPDRFFRIVAAGRGGRLAKERASRKIDGGVALSFAALAAVERSSRCQKPDDSLLAEVGALNLSLTGPSAWRAGD